VLEPNCFRRLQSVEVDLKFGDVLGLTGSHIGEAGVVILTNDAEISLERLAHEAAILG